ncbi:hypothetical protein, partial [Candidatus Methanarcanum hacksteinii]|uniref:hypothetical protein n=1 Tax=Candidatus Methanarcanum hacksteinii TaxID=2911857 RepID=UPI0037DC27C2
MKISATTTGLGTITGVGLWVYGDVASNQEATLSAADVVTIVNATVTSLTIKCSPQTNIISAEGNSTFTATASGLGVTTYTDGSVTLVNGIFTTAITSVPGTFTISSGASLTISSAAKIELTGKMIVYGTITSNNTSTKEIEVQANASVPAEFRSFEGSIVHQTISVTLEANTPGSTVSGIISMVTETKYVNGTTTGDENYPQSQDVVVNDYYDVKGNSTVAIAGNFEIPEGTTVTIYKGSTISVTGFTSVVKVAGKLIVEEGAIFSVGGGKSVSITGTVQSEGTLSFSSESVKIENGGVVNNLGQFYSSASASMSVGAGSELNLSGSIITGNVSINNSGSIVVEDVALGSHDVTISNVSNGATVKIISYTANSEKGIVINDSGMTYGNITSLGTGNSVTMKLKFSSGTSNPGCGGIVVVSSIVFEGSNNTPYKSMDVSGSLEVFNPGNARLDTCSTYTTISVSGPRVVVSDKLVFNDGVELTVAASAVLTVAGELS